MFNTYASTDGTLFDLEETFVFVRHPVLGTQRAPVDAFAAVDVGAATHRNALNVQYADLVLWTLHSIAGVAYAYIHTEFSISLNTCNLYGMSFIEGL